MRVLVVEDEIRLADNIGQALREGPRYAVDISHDGAEALEFFHAGAYDLILLDLMLPRINGRDVLGKLRNIKNVPPVLILTAVADKEQIVALLNAGASDFLTKPFDLGELIARCRALIRRSRGVSEATLRFEDVELNVTDFSARRGGRSLDLTRIEFRILEYLMYQPKVLVSKRELLEHLYDFTWERHPNVVEVHISNLRRKLRGTGEWGILENIRGRGYRLSPAVYGE